MKFKTTLIILAIFLVLLAVVYFFEIKGKSEEEAEEKLIDLSSDDVQKIIFKTMDEIIIFERYEEEWLIKEPLEAKADKYEVNRLADDFSELSIERIVEEMSEEKNLEKYEIPQKEITLFFKEREEPIKILIGMENPLDNTFFAKREDQGRIVLIPSSLKTLLEKSLNDFRMKDIFKFETDEVKNVKLQVKKIRWEAQKEEDEWFLKKPFVALAESSKISDLLYSLSNLKATEFISEEKNDEEVKKYRLDHPEYKISLDMPVANQEVTFFLQKHKDKLYATTSLSNKIITTEDSILSDLEKAPEELREKEVADFYSWQANKLHLKQTDIDWTLTKDEDDNWHFEFPIKEEANKSKIETFIRKIESLEAEEFIDPPLNLKDYGLEDPYSAVKIWVKKDEKDAKEITVFIGTENKEEKKVVVKNARFDYLFRLDSAFLDEFPKELKDWKAEKERKEEEK